MLALAKGIVKNKPIEEKDYRKKEGEFEGIKEEHIEAITTELLKI